MTAIDGPRTLCEAFGETVRTRGNDVALRNFGGESSLTWAGYDGEVRKVSAGLSTLGVGHGDTVAMLLTNRMECHIVDMAVAHLGGVPFSVYHTSPPDQIRHFLDVSDTRVVVTEHEYLDGLRVAIRLYGRAVTIVIVDGDGHDEGHQDNEMTLADVVEAGRGIDATDVWAAVQPDDVATLIFTSGTTGAPKGAQWSHHGVMTTVRRVGAAIPLPLDNHISYLPMAHAGCRLVVYYTSIVTGAATTFCPNYQELGRYVADARPDRTMMSVPRIWEKLKIAIQGWVDDLAPDDRDRIKRGIDIGIERTRTSRAGQAPDTNPDDTAAYETGRDLIRALVLRPLGLDLVTVAVNGGAPPPKDVVEFYFGIGIPFLDAYGCTECGGFAVFNRPDDFRLGTAGKPLPETEIKLADDGEIMIRSPSNMVGYRKLPQASKDAFDSDGWLLTGDIGQFDADGYMSIVDRKKELIINSAGKNMSPANIERAIRTESDLIAQVVAIGDGRPYNVGLITLELEPTLALAVELGLPRDSSIEVIAADPFVRSRIEEAVARGNSKLARTEQLKRFHVVGAAWVPDSDEMTPTGKVKRRIVRQKYSADIDALYELGNESRRSALAVGADPA